MKQEVNRRVFLERLGVGVIGGAALSQGLGLRAGAQGGPSPAAGSMPPTLVNPNILIILVDQMRWPCWLTSTQQTTLDTTMLPNIFGRLRDKSYVFQQYSTAATVCTASRATLLTGLYAPQTAVYVGAFRHSPSTTPNLNPAFPTWASALAGLNPAYANSCLWFGKWHLSACIPSPKQYTKPLQPYGFDTRNYPGGPNCADPTAVANEGTGGGAFNGGKIWASDAMIASDFVNWLPTAPANLPWCATVSFCNPHDITSAPRTLKYPYQGPANKAWFQPPAWFTTTGGAPNELNPPEGFPMLYTPDGAPNQTVPNPWNWENLPKLGDEGSGGIKPDEQLAFQSATSGVPDWTLFLNQYYWLQEYVDQQVGVVLNALNAFPQVAANTIIIFTSDHGEYAGSHGLHDKGYAAYDESIHVPFYVQFPGQTAGITMNQMCSSVDFFRLVCDLGTGGQTGAAGGPFVTQYPDQQNRQRIWSFLYNNAMETRVAPQLGNTPYVFHTCDMNDYLPPTATKIHLGCLRGKNSGAQPAKLAIYWEWAQCTTCPDGLAQDYEFYDYSSTNNNTRETGNNYNGWTGTYNQTLQTNYLNAIGNWGGWSSPANAPGLIATELDAPLVGFGTDSQPLSQAQATAQQTYLAYRFGTGCTQ